MARENDVRLFGEITEIQRDAESGSTLFKLRTLRRNTERTDFIRVEILQEHAKMAEDIAVGDYVDVQGFFSTWDNEDHLDCPNCGESVRDVTFHSAVIAMYVRKHNGPISLEDHREVSNRIYLMGQVSGKVNALTIQSKDSEFDTTRYRLNVKRKIRLPHTDKDNDRPFISSFGGQAVNDSLRLQDGGLVFINGSVQSRNIFVKRVCPHCETVTTMEKPIMEIVPMGVEYLRGCRSWSHYSTAECED